MLPKSVVKQQMISIVIRWEEVAFKNNIISAAIAVVTRAKDVVITRARLTLTTFKSQGGKST